MLRFTKYFTKLLQMLEDYLFSKLCILSKAISPPRTWITDLFDRAMVLFRIRTATSRSVVVPRVYLHSRSCPLTKECVDDIMCWSADNVFRSLVQCQARWP